MADRPFVLLIEPQKLLGQTYRRALEHAGYEVGIVREAESAIVAADSRTPALVIVELRLPHHDGIEFLYEFRSYPEWQAVPVIVHTVVAPSMLALTGDALQRDLGVSACLYKPQVSLAQLLQAAKKAVS